MASSNSLNPLLNSPLIPEKVSAASWPSDQLVASARDTLQLLHGQSVPNYHPEYDFTRIDLHNTTGITESEIQGLIARRLNVKDIGNNLEQKLSDLQNIYDESLSFMQRVLYLKIPLWLRNKKWNSVMEFTKAISEHTGGGLHGTKKKNGAYSNMFCAILKTMVVESDIYRNPKIDQLDQHLEDLNSHLKTTLELKEVRKKRGRKWENEPRYIEYKLDGHTIRIASRAKTRDAIRLKEIFKRKYQSIDDFGDLLGVEIELDKTLDLYAQTHIISRVKLALYGKAKIKNIDGIPTRIPVILEVKGSVLSNAAITDLERQGEIKISKKKHSAVSSLDFEDAKFTPAPATIKDTNGKRYSLKPEVRFVKSENRNESGFATHDIMDLKRVLTANARLFGALTLGNLRYILDKFPYENHEDGTPKTTAEITKSRHAILNHLLYPEKYSDGSTAQYPFLLILSAKSTHSGEYKIYLTTNNAFFSEDGNYSLENIYSEYPHPVDVQGANIADTLEKIHIAINNVLTLGTTTQ